MLEIDFIQSLLALSPPSGGQGGQSTAPFYVQMFPLFLMVFVFYFVFIRPQQKKARELGILLKSLKAGDRVVTTSGIIGVVVGVKDKTLTLRTADTKLELLKSAVNEVTERGTSTAEPPQN